MSEPEQLESENLVAVYRARDEWEAQIITGYLGDCGIEATSQAHASRSKSGVSAGYYEPDSGCAVMVLESSQARAEECIARFKMAITDDQLLEEAAASQLRLDRDTIARLRKALRQERETFDLLEWLVVAFCVATAFLWALWPDWMQTGLSFGVMRWVTAGMLLLSALLVGQLVGRGNK